MVSLKNFKTQKSLIPTDPAKPEIDSVQGGKIQEASEPENNPGNGPPENAIGDDAANAPRKAEPENDPSEEFQKPEQPKWTNPRLPASLPKSTKPQFTERDFQGEIKRFISQANSIFSRAPENLRERITSSPPTDETFWAEFERHQDKIFTAKNDKNMIVVRSAIGEACQFLRERFEK
jgi:hypothetical protein